MENLGKVQDNEVYTNTKILAEKLSDGKDQHRNVITTLERLMGKDIIFASEARLTSYPTLRNNIYPMYELTESGHKKLLTAIKDTYNKTKSSKVYIMHDGEFIKIGIASNVNSRLRGVQTGNPREVKVIYSSQPIKNAQQIETKAHNHFSKKRLMGEWFDVKPMDAFYYIENLVNGGKEC